MSHFSVGDTVERISDPKSLYDLHIGSRWIISGIREVDGFLYLKNLPQAWNPSKFKKVYTKQSGFKKFQHKLKKT